MAIFGILKFDSVVQVGDKIRLDASKSFVSKDEASVTLIEIEPEAASGFVDVTGSSFDDWYLDWVYSGTSRTVTVSVRITTDGGPSTFTKDLEIKTEADDNLFSNDDGIFKHETELESFIPDGRSSYNYVHRKSKELILDWFNEMGLRKTDGSKITEAEVIDLEEVRKWSELWTLSLIYKDLSNSIGDKFDQKMQFYSEKAMDARNRTIFKLDVTGDGSISTNEGYSMGSNRIFRT